MIIHHLWFVYTVVVIFIIVYLALTFGIANEYLRGCALSYGWFELTKMMILAAVLFMVVAGATVEYQTEAAMELELNNDLIIV